MKLKLIALIIMTIFVVYGCKDKTNLESKNQAYACYEQIVNNAKENNSLDIHSIIFYYCGNEVVDGTQIKASNYGYKSKIILINNNREYGGAYYPYLREVMKWLKNNSKKEDKILAWWDYGPMIKVFADREPIAMYPSKEALKYVGMYQFNKSAYDGLLLEDDTEIRKIATLLTTNNLEEALKIMKEFNAKYLLIPRDIESKFPVIYDLVYKDGKFRSLKNAENTGILEDSELDSESVTYRTLNGQEMNGFRKVYSDENAAIYVTTR